MYRPAELLALSQLLKHASEVARYAERAPLFTAVTAQPYLEDLLAKAAADLTRLQTRKENPCLENATASASPPAPSPAHGAASSASSQTPGT